VSWHWQFRVILGRVLRVPDRTRGVVTPVPINPGRVKREWSRHIAITADRVMGSGYDIVHAFAEMLSVGPRTSSLRRDDNFKEATDAAMF